MHTDLETLATRIGTIRRQRDHGDITPAEADHLITLEAACCALHDHGDGDEAA